MEKSHLFANKSLYMRNVGLTKPVKVLYVQKLVYWNPVKNQNYLKYTGPTKLGKVNTAIRTKSSLVGPVKNWIAFMMFCACEILSWKKKVWNSPNNLICITTYLEGKTKCLIIKLGLCCCILSPNVFIKLIPSN